MINIYNSKQNIKPNATCRNPRCPHGENGKPKKYYVCRYCDRVVSWRSIGCCEECAKEYSADVRIDRGITVEQEIIENRTDMTPDQYKEIMETPIEKVAEYTKNVELVDYKKDIEEVGLSDTIDKINKELDANYSIETEVQIEEIEPIEETTTSTKRTRRSKFIS